MARFETDDMDSFIKKCGIGNISYPNKIVLGNLSLRIIIKKISDCQLSMPEFASKLSELTSSLAFSVYVFLQDEFESIEK